MQILLAWIVPSATGVMLIDTGLNAAAPDILAALQRRSLGPESVRGMLITHGHGDHFGGTAAFPGAPVFAHRDDIPWIRGEVKRTGKAQGFSRRPVDVISPEASQRNKNSLHI